MISVILHILGGFYCPEHGLIWWMLQVYLKKVCIIWLLGGVFYEYVFVQVDNSVFQLFVCLLILYLLVLPITKRWILKSLTIIMDLFTALFSSITFCFVYIKLCYKVYVCIFRCMLFDELTFYYYIILLFILGNFFSTWSLFNLMLI